MTSHRFGTVVWRVAAILPLWFTSSLVFNGSVGAAARAMVASICIVSVVSPMHGLLLVAIAAPLGDLMTSLLETGPMRLTEAAAMAFLGGWLLRGPADRRPGPTPYASVRYGAWALAGIVLAQNPFGAVAAFRWLEGLALAAAVVVLLRRSPIVATRLPEAMGIGCVVAVVSARLPWVGVALPGGVETGSYFSLMLCLAIGMAAREGGRKALGWLAVALCAVIGLWLGRSRSAEGATAVAIVSAILWALARGWSPRVRVASLTLLVIGVVAAWSHRSAGAHNDFLQTGAELGLLGLGACLVTMVGVFWSAVRSLAATPEDYRLLGLLAGMSAFLLTCVTGHPLLVFESAFPFWLSIGLLVATTSPVPALDVLKYGARIR